MSFTDAQLIAWVQHFVWPLIRISALFMIAPVLGARAVSPRIRLLLALVITAVVAPLLPAPPVTAPLSAPWFSTLLQQLLIGLIAGFVLLLVFEAVVMGAELIAFGMGLGFAQLADPLRGTTTPVIGQFLTVMASLLFLALGGHLILIEMIVASFATLPIGSEGLGIDQIGTLLRFAGIMFSGGLQLALPIVIALLTVNLAMGVVSRSAPTLNLFAVGFPVTLVAGLLLLRAGLPALGEGVVQLLDEAWVLLGALLRL
ncbi:flagellar biosynthetic protein FliR [Sinimarinibacterium thermocellulolyticum]|uniref:Flagellar biosynthetic protein FliR n=1 Tax=Sinimarinibacterium thermocellulolyticum TaxID=3170016 RepID=A0ABV2AA19_9GAMM